MSFFRKDLSAYPQPVVVTPDPAYAGEAISDAVAEAIDSEHTHNARQEEQCSSHITSTAGAAGKVRATGSAQAPELSETATAQIAQARDSTGSGKDMRGGLLNAQQHSDSTYDGSGETTARLADGVMSLLGPIVQEMDFNIVSVRKSQTELEKEIERLMAELQLFMASSAAPPEVEPAVQKLIKARRQIMAANSTLKTVQDRVDRLHVQIEKRQ